MYANSKERQDFINSHIIECQELKRAPFVSTSGQEGDKKEIEMKLKHFFSLHSFEDKKPWTHERPKKNQNTHWNSVHSYTGIMAAPCACLISLHLHSKKKWLDKDLSTPSKLICKQAGNWVHALHLLEQYLDQYNVQLIAYASSPLFYLFQMTINELVSWFSFLFCLQLSQGLLGNSLSPRHLGMLKTLTQS